MWKPLFGFLTIFALCGFTAANDAKSNLPPIVVLPVAFDANGLSGPGGDRLKSELDDAQFIAVGEDHGFADSPLLARALAAEVRKNGDPLFHAAEIGPFSAKWLRQKFGKKGSASGLNAVAAAMKGKGMAMPFTSNVEDATLAADFFDRSGKSRLWGIDQEFIGASLILLERLETGTSDAKLRKSLNDILKADQLALGKMSIGETWLGKTGQDEFEVLANGMDGDAEAIRLVKAFADSAEIYQLDSTGAYQASNERRSALMQGYFLEQYRKAGSSARVLLKMGAYHLGRGTTPVGIYDLGSLLPGLAVANGMKSLHIAYIPMAGSVRTFGLSETGVTVVKPYKDEGIAELLAAANIAAEAIPPTGHVLIPLANIRYRISGKQKRELTEIARFVLTGFDYLVTTRDARAATHFEAWVPVAD